MSEVKETVQYQWIKGENFGQIVEVESTDGKLIYFTNGTKILKTAVNEFMQPVVNGEIPMPGAEKAAQVLFGKKETKATKPAPVQTQTPAESNNPKSSQSPEPTIMGNMIMKMSKKNVVNVPIQINLNIPTPALYAMLSEGMEQEDLNDEIMAVALQQIEIDNLTDYLKENVSLFLSEYYS